MPRLTLLLIITLLIFLFEISSGAPDGVSEGGSNISPEYLISKISHRKVFMETLDYDYGGPNTRHDPPRKGKPGVGGKNP